MKRKPIKAEHYGCRFSVIYEVFPKNEKLEGAGVNLYILRINENLEIDVDGKTLKSVMNKYTKSISESDLIEFIVDTPLHNEVYELNKDDMEFYLVEQGQGYA
ncbi:MAG: hypothetical protein KIB00_17755 [Paeniclostridium sordellii]|nr:hypothetical protein [Paeniclostridium sordellii]